MQTARRLATKAFRVGSGIAWLQPGCSQNNFRIIVTLHADATKDIFKDQHLHVAPLRSCWLVKIARILAVVFRQKEGAGVRPLKN